MLIPSQYNRQAYVPGGSTRRVAQAIQSRGRLRKPIIRPRPVNPAVRGGAASVDPLWTRANSTVMGMVSPLITQLANQRALAEKNARSAYGAHAAGLEGALTASGAPLNTAYDSAIRSAAATEDAVANRLRGAGQTASQGLAAQLAQIQAPGHSSIPQVYAGAEGAEFARGSADVQRLIGRGAETRAYLGKLPSIGRLAANQDLSQALSEMGAQFGERERGLQEQALGQAWDLYGNMRQEKNQNAQFIAQQISNAEERAAKERMALTALKATASSKAEERMFDQQMKALDRQLEWDKAQLSSQTSLSTDNPPAPPSVVGPANQKFVSVNGRRVKNPNYVPPAKAGAAKGNQNDSWQTPGSMKRERVVRSVFESIVNPNTGSIRQKFTDSATPDKDISRKIWQAMRLAGVTDTTSPAAKKLWRDIFLTLEGTPSRLGAYQLPGFVRR